MSARTSRFLNLWWLAVVGWMAIIFRLSALTGSQVPGRFGAPGHFVGYAVLGALCFMALHVKRTAPIAFVLAVLLCSAYGITDEFHQSFVPGRAPDVVDWGVDTIGAAIGALMMWLVAQGAARRRPKMTQER